MTLDLKNRDFVLDNLDKLPPQEKEKLDNDFLARYLVDSTTMEKKVSFTLEEAYDLIENGIFSLRNKASSHDVIQVVNQKKAYDYMLAKTRENDTFLTEDLIKSFHEIIMDGILAGGVYRNVDIRVHGSKHVPTNYIRVYEKMENLIVEIEEYKNDPVYLATYVNARLDKIHPFLDGNGRCSRLVVNYILIKNNYLPISIDESYKRRYFDALEEYKINRNLNDLHSLFIELENNELEKYATAIRRYI